MKPVTERDVVRLFDGELDDPIELRRVLAAIETDPKLRLLAELFTDAEEVDDEPGDQELEAGEFAFPDLTRTRLCRLPSEWEWLHTAFRDDVTPLENMHHVGSVSEWAISRPFSAPVAYAAESVIRTFDLRITPEGNLGRVRLDADWPRGLQPIGFILSQIDFARGRMPFSKTVTLPSVHTSPESKASEEATQLQTFAAAARTDAPMDAGDSTDFYADVNERGRVVLRARLEEERDYEIVIAEVNYRNSDGSDLTVCLPAQLDKVPNDNYAEATITDFPWPTEAGSRQATLTIRPLTPEDVPPLSNRLVSALLAQEDEFVAVSILPDETGQLTAEFRLPIQRQLASDPRTSWFLQIQEQGGEQ